HYGRAPLLRSVRSMAAYFFFGLLLLPLSGVAAFIAVGWSLRRITDPIWCLFHYSPAFMLGTFVTAPPLALAARNWKRWGRAPRAQFAEAGLLAAALLGSTQWVFGRTTATDVPALL